jgi:eukaryotic-like serine/threonine-protein kinase
MLEAGEAVGVYRVLDRVGAGATAEVYRIKHQRLQSEYALKVIHPRGPSDVRRLENEGAVQSKLHHPNIVQVMDVLAVGGSLGLIMEFVEGPDLASWLEDHHPSTREAIDLFDAIVRGVQHAHDAGLVHRDLKPANVLLQRVREGLVPKVSDFGIAKMFGDISPGQTMQGIAMGTPRYMAPEQFTDAASVDQRADLFSLGCILYELVTGESAFSPSNLFEAHDSARQAAYRELPIDMPEEIKRAIKGCLEPDRELRIADCQTLLTVLGRPTHAKATATPIPIQTLPPPESRPISEKTVAMTIAPLPESMMTDGTLSARAQPTTVPELEPPSRTRLGVFAGIVAVAILVGVVAYATSRGPTDAAVVPSPSPEPVATAPIVPASVAQPTQVPAQPEAAPPPVVERRTPKAEPKAQAKPPEVKPSAVAGEPAVIASALFVVDAADDLLVTCGGRSSPGTTIAKPTKFPAGLCTVTAHVNGVTLVTTVDVREKARFVCAPKAGSLVCVRG